MRLLCIFRKLLGSHRNSEHEQYGNEMLCCAYPCSLILFVLEEPFTAAMYIHDCIRKVCCIHLQVAPKLVKN